MVTHCKLQPQAIVLCIWSKWAARIFPSESVGVIISGKCIGQGPRLKDKKHITFYEKRQKHMKITLIQREMESMQLIVLDGTYQTADLTFPSSCGAKASGRLVATAHAVHLQSVMDFSQQR